MAEHPWEDFLLERKVESDLKDLLKTFVAFANSVKPGHTAIVLIGERNDGTAQGVTNPENIQKTVRETCNKIYPPIVWKSFVYDRDGKICVRVEIDYDGDTPHFGGASWVRRGPVTEKASADVFQLLIEFRLGKVRELAKWIQKEITVEADLGKLYDIRLGPVSYETHPRLPIGPKKAILEFVNGFWTTFKMNGATQSQSEPLEKVVLSWDDKESRLKLLIRA